jgi:hypothetical protein
MHSPKFTRSESAMFLLFYLLAGAFFGWLFIHYITEPDPFLNRGPQVEERE